MGNQFGEQSSSDVDVLWNLLEVFSLKMFTFEYIDFLIVNFKRTMVSLSRPM